MENNALFKVNVKGGILPIGELEFIVNTVKKYGVKELFFGERQNLYFKAHRRIKEVIENSVNAKGYDIEVDEDIFPNIVSSYSSEDIFTSNSWLSEGIYQDILNSISFRPLLKINIVDSYQGLIPWFTGHLNFVSSTQLNFWYLYIKLPKSKNLQRWPVLIYSTEIGRLIKYLETAFAVEKEIDVNKIANKVREDLQLIVTDITEELPLNSSRFPNYEGLNKIGDKYWLGIYRREDAFPIEFLNALCQQCLESKIGKLCITSYKSLIIKGIPESSKQKWEKFLGAFGINIRHSSLELNWQVPDLDASALKLKTFLVKSFDKEDVQTYGLGFTIKTMPMDVAGSIIIEKKGRLNIGNLMLFPIYNIYYAKDFNPNSLEWEVYAVDIIKNDLPYYLIQLCKVYYEQLGKEEQRVLKIRSTEEVIKQAERAYQCMDCLSIYIERFGDEVNNIPPNTTFSELPEGYSCPVCEGPKSRYQERKMSLIN